MNLHILHGMSMSDEDDPEDDTTIVDEEPNLDLVGLGVGIVGRVCTSHY